MNDEPNRNDERVRVRAYVLWERDGRPHGRNEAYWAEALRQIQDEEREKSETADGVTAESRPDHH
ncbi:DUF2934 domain-containing protein [Lichenicoccus roseus]|uniref:DUF2934 domain-containing protein n=1 Tax=Lichenicoccus roseus TaxID=2683649 RepID=A0A5R9JFT1_9PROT|nr:DUF2934 domain-containing protein [Lichenicoccus roseus]TLU73138.1 DUF2934 domain-containing protein [Lichenicoccus roseus]